MVGETFTSGGQAEVRKTKGEIGALSQLEPIFQVDIQFISNVKACARNMGKL